MKRNSRYLNVTKNTDIFQYERLVDPYACVLMKITRNSFPDRRINEKDVDVNEL